MTMTLTLKHGRNDPEADMEEWGYDGPQISFEALTVVYMQALRLFIGDKFIAGRFAETYGLRQDFQADQVEVAIFEDMLCVPRFPGEPCPGPHYFGDWSIVEDK